jgi:23S rRNA (uracil1939-C5)-methyltransferase
LIAAARRNATLNNLDNVEFQVANLYDDTGVPPWAGVKFDKLLLDPPRSGAMEVIQRLREPRPARLVYVSCDPATLARDSGHLVSHLGYRLAAAGVLDMFPHTSHVEAMAVFSRPGHV